MKLILIMYARGPGWMWDDKPLRISALSIRNVEPDAKTGSRAIACGHLLKTILMQKRH